MMANVECLFCDEDRQGQNSFLEDELFRARWDQIPLRPGHAEIVPKRHVQFFDELTDEELNRMLVFARDVINVIKRIDELPTVYTDLLTGSSDYVRPYLEQAAEASRQITTAPTAFNHGVNDGPDGGQSVPHFHYHVIPRWKGDVENPRGGIRRMFGEDEYSNG